MQCVIPWSSDKGSAKAASTPQPLKHSWVKSIYKFLMEQLLWRAVFTVYLHCLFRLCIFQVNTTWSLHRNDFFQRKILSQLVRCFFLCYIEALMPASWEHGLSPTYHISLSTGIQKSRFSILQAGEGMARSLAITQQVTAGPGYKEVSRHPSWLSHKLTSTSSRTLPMHWHERACLI